MRCVYGALRAGNIEVRCLDSTTRRLAAALITLLAGAISYACVSPSPARAHDIPADVKINAFFKPAGDRLELLVRLPLASLIDTDFPMRGAFLDLARADEPIRGGIKVWLTDNIDVYERSEEHTSELQSHLNLVC